MRVKAIGEPNHSKPAGFVNGPAGEVGREMYPGGPRIYGPHRVYHGDVFDIPDEPKHEDDVRDRGGKVVIKAGTPKAFSPRWMTPVDVSVPERVSPQVPAGKHSATNGEDI